MNSPYTNYKPVTKAEFYGVIGSTPGESHITNRFEHQGRGFITHHYRGAYADSGTIGISHSGSFPFTRPEYFIDASIDLKKVTPAHVLPDLIDRCQTTK